jgi:hypothetical protein
MECRSGGVVRSVGALRCGRQLFFRLCVSFVSQDMDECTCNVDAGRSNEGREWGSRLRTRKGQQRRCAVSGADIAYAEGFKLL